MRIAQLSRTSGVPVATVKYYLRERLLHDGKLTSPTQAQYDESHVERLRLVVALLGPGGLSVAAARRVLDALADPPASTHELLGVAHHAVLGPPPAEDPDLTDVCALVHRWGWQVHDQDRATLAALAVALQGLADAGFELPAERLDHYARSMAEVAAVELAATPTESPEAAVRYVVLGTVLVEPLLLALRRLAQQDASARRFGR